MMLRDSYETILFDVGNTLLVDELPDYEILTERCQMVGLPFEEETAHRAWKQSEAWAGEQILRESHGAPRMPDDEFNRRLDCAALRTALPDKTEDEIGHLTTRLQAVPKRKQAWKLADMVHQTLAKLKARGFTLGIVSNFDETLPALCDQFGLTLFRRHRCIICRRRRKARSRDLAHRMSTT